MRIFLEEMMLDFPGKVVTEPVRQLELIERIMIKDELAIGCPGPRQLQLVENAELHFSSRGHETQLMARRKKL